MIGTSQPRKEDRRLLVGEGRYVGDLALEGALHVGYVTSSVAPARLGRVEVSAAKAAPGIVDVVTNDDLTFAPLPPIARFVPNTMTRTMLASGTVRYVGEPIVAVVG